MSAEPGPARSRVWVHSDGFASYHEARQARFERYEEHRLHWDKEHAKLKQLVARM